MIMFHNVALLNYVITGCIFVSGFFVSRVFIKADLASRVLIKVLKFGTGKFTHLILIIMLSSALLSSFIPNMITVLTLLPIISSLYKDFSYTENSRGDISTPLIVSLIYGANIGGIVSITGSPSNALLIGYLPILQSKYNIHFAGIEKINFFSWLAFGIPTAFILILIGWLLVTLLTIPANIKKTTLDFHKIEHTSDRHNLQRIALFIALINFICWMLISVIQTLFPQIVIYLAVLSLLCTIVFIWVIFFVKVKYNSKIKKPILQIKDSYSGLPKKGVLLSIVAVIFAILLFAFNVPKLILSILGNFTFVKALPLIFVFFAFAVVTSFLTEIFSNSVVALTILPVATLAGISLQFSPLTLLFLISFSTTCAFMSPMATPVNAFAFGSLDGISLKKMLFTGLVMNVVSALWLGLSSFYFLPLFL